MGITILNDLFIYLKNIFDISLIERIVELHLLILSTLARKEILLL